jgi:hypothetical protein
LNSYVKKNVWMLEGIEYYGIDQTDLPYCPVSKE